MLYNLPEKEGSVKPIDRLILALDVDNAFQALQLVRLLKDHVGAFKVGLELVNAAGVGIFEKLQDAGASRLFYDAKIHDIPNTAAGAMRAIARHGIWMTNVHAAGGSRMIRAAADSLRETSQQLGTRAPLLLAVTLLTSLSAAELETELHSRLAPESYVVAMARMTQAAGGQGVVASPREIEAVRAACGPDFLIVTPGVRPAGADAGDQRRTMTPGEAISRGADYLVIGRPITAAKDPVATAETIRREVEGAVGQPS
jgi:orotidine-5'-phosphate decarboxylase